MESSSQRAYTLWQPSKGRTVPQYVRGIDARPSTTPTMKGVYDWMSREGIRKFYPIFSHLSYSTFLSLSQENIDNILADLGATPLPHGVQYLLLRSVGLMRRRIDYLKDIDELTPLDDVARIFFHIARTPLSSTDPEPSGEYLLDAVQQKFDFLVDVHGARLFAHDLFATALRCYISCLEVPMEHKDHMSTKYLAFTPNFKRCISHRLDHCRSYALLVIKLTLFIQRSPKPPRSLRSNRSPRSPESPRPPESPRAHLGDIFQHVIQRPKTSLPSSSSSPPAPVSSPSDGGQLSCNYAQAVRGLSIKNLRNTYNDSRYVVDSDLTWGGGQNQVLFELGVW